MAESVRVISPFVDPTALSHGRALQPTAREWIRHSLLFVLTIATTTFAGMALASEANSLDVQIPDPVKLTDYLFYIPEYYARSVGELLSYAFHHPPIIWQGLTFSAALL